MSPVTCLCLVSLKHVKIFIFLLIGLLHADVGCAAGVLEEQAACFQRSNKAGGSKYVQNVGSMSVWCNQPRTELISTINDHESIT
jgi:hypothetical protein